MYHESLWLNYFFLRLSLKGSVTIKWSIDGDGAYDCSTEWWRVGTGGEVHRKQPKK